MYHQQVSGLQVAEPKVPNMENWFQFLQEAPAMLTGRLHMKFFGKMIWVPNLPVHFISLEILHAETPEALSNSLCHC